MTKDNLNFADLIPERDTLTMPDGRVIEFVTRMDFSAEDIAKAINMSGRIEVLVKLFKDRSPTDDEGRQFDAVTTEFVKFVLPDAPADFLNALKLGTKVKMMEWWKTRNMAEEKSDGPKVPEKPSNGSSPD